VSSFPREILGALGVAVVGKLTEDTSPPETLLEALGNTPNEALGALPVSVLVLEARLNAEDELLLPAARLARREEGRPEPREAREEVDLDSEVVVSSGVTMLGAVTPLNPNESNLVTNAVSARRSSSRIVRS